MSADITAFDRYAAGVTATVGQLRDDITRLLDKYEEKLDDVIKTTHNTDKAVAELKVTVRSAIDSADKAQAATAILKSRVEKLEQRDSFYRGALAGLGALSVLMAAFAIYLSLYPPGAGQ